MRARGERMRAEMIADLLRDNWLLFGLLNQPAGHQPLLDPLMMLGANDLIVLVPLCLLVLWFALARWSPLAKAETTGGAGSVRAIAQQLALLACAAVVISLVANQVAARILPEQRPFVTHPSQTHLLIAHAADKSFPSDHESVASAIAIMLIVVAVWLRAASARLRQLAIILAIVGVVCALYIGVSRIYVGVHYPGDILGGVGCGALGAAIASGARRFTAPVLNPIVRLAERLKLA